MFANGGVTAGAGSTRLALIELLAVVGAAPLLMFPSRFSIVALLVLPAVWLARLLLPGLPNPSSASDWPFAGMLLMTSVSLYPSIDLSLSRPKLFGLILGFAVFRLVVGWLWVGPGTGLLAGFLVLGGIGVALVGLVGTDWLTPKVPFLAPVDARPHPAGGGSSGTLGIEPSPARGGATGNGRHGGDPRPCDRVWLGGRGWHSAHRFSPLPVQARCGRSE